MIKAYMMYDTYCVHHLPPLLPENRWNFLYPRPEFYKGAIVSNDTETYWHYDETAKAITLELMSVSFTT